MKAQPRAPVVLAAAAFAGGIWLAGHLQNSAIFFACSATVLALCAVAAVRINTLRLAQCAAALALVFSGAYARLATPVPRLVTPPPEFFRTALDSPREVKVEIVAHVTNDGTLAVIDESRERFEMKTESIELDGAKFVQPVGIRGTVYSSHALPEGAQPAPRLAYGQRIHLLAKLRLPHNFGNSGAFDYEGYLHSHGIGVLASVKDDDIEVLPGTAACVTAS